MLFITNNVFEKLLPVHFCIPFFGNPFYVHVPLQNEVFKNWLAFMHVQHWSIDFLFLVNNLLLKSSLLVKCVSLILICKGFRVLKKLIWILSMCLYDHLHWMNWWVALSIFVAYCTILVGQCTLIKDWLSMNST